MALMIGIERTLYHCKFLTGFAKGGPIHASNFATLKRDTRNFVHG